jgi:hypothetical protein
VILRGRQPRRVRRASRATAFALGIAAAILAGGGAAEGQRLIGRPAVTLAEADRVRLAESFRLAEALRESVWPGWSDAPFAVLLVTPDAEFLLRHPAPSADFESLGDDPLLGSAVSVRARVFPPALLATFPAVGGVPTIVVGQPERTGKASTPWVLTLVHEHFHQMQNSRPGYYGGVAALDLADGDQTGMWMLNFPFPYGDAAVQARFADAARAVADAVEAVGTADFAARAEAARDAEARLYAALDDRDARYLRFQLWQEGVARYTELRVAELAAERYTLIPVFAALPDHTSFAAAAAELRSEVLRELRAAELGTRRRVAFYALGAGLALLLDETDPEWKARYWSRPFTLDGG